MHTICFNVKVNCTICWHAEHLVNVAYRKRKAIPMRQQSIAVRWHIPRGNALPGDLLMVVTTGLSLQGHGLRDSRHRGVLRLYGVATRRCCPRGYGLIATWLPNYGYKQLQINLLILQKTY